ncbi:MAG: class I SAM-dependent methyltransferase [Leptospiraceae bacterium]|nr:class I SAM-dependent methyltransferase [Leptospiraceae bacterium]
MPEQKVFDPAAYSFPRFEYAHYFRGLWRERGAKAIYKQFQKHLRRPISRRIVSDFSHASTNMEVQGSRGARGPSAREATNMEVQGSRGARGPSAREPHGFGLEIGVGARTIAPVSRTLLADGYESHGRDRSIAQVYFRAAAIPFVAESFDFVLSEHTLEHIGNVLRALREWIRVLKPGGHLILFLPHQERTNDRLRERTTLAHLIDDEKREVPDDDTTHVDEWIANVTRAGGIPEHYRHIAKDELARTGSIHHHVWIAADIKEVFEYLGLRVVYLSEQVADRSDSFVVVGEKQS